MLVVVRNHRRERTVGIAFTDALARFKTKGSLTWLPFFRSHRGPDRGVGRPRGGVGAASDDRSRRYSSPERRAARDSRVPPVARSYSKSPSSTLIVVLNDERTEPLIISQFQPPSRSPNSRSTIGDTSTPK